MKLSELAFILWFNSAVVQVIGETEILLTRPEKEKLWFWADYGNKDSNKMISGWQHPTTAKTVYSVCDVQATVAPINWLRSYFVDVDGANRIVVNIEYDLRCPNSIKECKTTFGLFVYHAENELTPDPTPTQESFSKVAEIAASSVPDANPTSYVSNSTFVTKKAGVYLALLDSGACFVIDRITISYQYCAAVGGVLVKFPKTVAPANNSHLVKQTGTCTSDYSVKKAKLSAECLSSGEWKVTDDIKCLCIRGYELVNGSGNTYKCEECKPGSYKNKVDNSNCKLCPLHSSSNPDRTTCICETGYYKQDDTIKACDALPAAPLLLNHTSVDGTSVVIRWHPTTSNKGQITYSVDCFKCKNQKDRNCEELCSSSVRYRPRKENIMQANVTVTGLSPVSYFLFRIYSVNDLNNLEKDRDKWNYRRVFVKTEGEHINPAGDGAGQIGMSKSLKMVLYIAVPIAGVAVILIIIIAICCIGGRRRRGYNQPIEMKDGRVILPSDGQRLYVDPSNYDDPEEALRNFAKELDKKQITLEKVIGGGEFGDVYNGVLTRPDEEPIPVAVKTLKATSRGKDRDDFLAEASIMGQFCDPNVIYLEGVVTKSLPLMIVIEFMSNGSLDNFLKRMDSKLSVLQLLGMARGVASGMKYLSDMNFVHRDLAARNVLVSESMVCKVADFGLSRELEDSAYETKGGKIPVRWTSPEAIDYRKFSWASDVWSYGIVLWEIMSFGERPYWEWSNFQVIERVKDGYRLPPPAGNQEECPKSIHNIMLNCWDVDRNKRPTFAAIVKKLEFLIRSPDRLNEEPSVSSNGPNLQCSEKTSVKEWLESIKMGRYTDMFVKRGYQNLGQLAKLEELDLNEVGVKLIGHKNKIRKSFREMKKGFLEETSVTSVAV